MKKDPVLKRQNPFFQKSGSRAFSLIEVVISLAICTFALLPMMVLLTNGLHLDRDARQQMQAADLATLLVITRRDSPTNTLSTALLPSLTGTYPASTTTTWVDYSGSSCPQNQAAFKLSYQVGTSPVNSSVGLIHVLLTWPPGADPTTAQGRYELTTQVLMPQ